MTPTRRLAIVIDCADPVRLAGFWSEAIGYAVVAEFGNYVVLHAPDAGERPTVILQRVTEPKAGKNRVHPDIYAPDVDAEAVRLEALGAARGELFAEDGFRWIVMRDPEGNEFCVVRES